MKNTIVLKKFFVICILIGTLLLSVNIVLAVIFRGETGSNIFTAVSGWISCVATLMIGVIASKQAMSYEFSTRQRQLIFEIEEEYKLFLEKSLIVCSVETYASMLIQGILNRDDDIKTQMEIECKKLSLANEINDLGVYMHGLKYCSLSTQPFLESLDSLKSFVCNNVKHVELGNVVDEESAKKFKSFYFELTDKLMSLVDDVRDKRNAISAEMQVVLRGVLNSKTLNELDQFENKVQEAFSNRQKQLLFNVDNKTNNTNQ